MHATILGASDADRLLAEIRKHSRGYRELCAMLFGDSDRTIEAIDQLIIRGKVDRILVGTDTHYRLAP